MPLASLLSRYVPFIITINSSIFWTFIFEVWLVAIPWSTFESDEGKSSKVWEDLTWPSLQYVFLSSSLAFWGSELLPMDEVSLY